MKKIKNLIIVLFLIVATTFLVGCNNEIPRYEATWEYNAQSKSVDIINKYESTNYPIKVDFKIILLDSNKEVLYEEDFEGEEIAPGQRESINLKDIIPDYISIDSVASMEVKVLKVCEGY